MHVNEMDCLRVTEVFVLGYIQGNLLIKCEKYHSSYLQIPWKIILKSFLYVYSEWKVIWDLSIKKKKLGESFNFQFNKSRKITLWIQHSLNYPHFLGDGNSIYWNEFDEFYTPKNTVYIVSDHLPFIFANKKFLWRFSIYIFCVVCVCKLKSLWGRQVRHKKYKFV